jgi:hypothetical protein
VNSPSLIHETGCGYDDEPCTCRTCRRVAAGALDRAEIAYPDPLISYSHGEVPEFWWPTEVTRSHDRAVHALEQGHTIVPAGDGWTIDWSTRRWSSDENGFAVIVALIGPFPPDVTTWHHPWLSETVADVMELAEQVACPTGTEATFFGDVIHLPDTVPDNAPYPTPKQILSLLGHYTSTYCLHDGHAECRLHCKQDRTELCNCWCHLELPPE